MARQSAISTGAGLVFVDETTGFTSAFPGVFLDESALARGAGEMDGAASMAGAGLLTVSGAARMDGAASVAATGSLVAPGVAHMDGVASMVGTTQFKFIGAGEMDGAGSMAAAGIVLSSITGQMDGSSSMAGAGMMLVDITGQMDGRGGLVAALPLGAAMGQMDGVASMAATGSLILPPPIVMEIDDGFKFSTINPASFLTYHLGLIQKLRFTDTALAPIHFKRVITQNLALADILKPKDVQKLIERITLHADFSTLTHYKYVFTDHLNVRDFQRPFWGLIVSLVQGLGVSQAFIAKIGLGGALHETLKFSLSQQVPGIYQKTLAQVFRFIQAFKYGRAVIVSERINLGSSSFLSVSVKLLQKLLVSSSSAPLLNYHLTLIGRMIFGDITGHYYFAALVLAELFNLHPVLDRQFVADQSLAELLTISPVFANKLILKLEGHLQLSPEQLVQMLYTGDELLDGITIQALYVSPSGTTTTWAVNTRTNAVTEYMNYDFRSFTKMGDRYIAASSEGLYELDGDTDDGTLIISELMSGYLQLNEKKMFGIKGAYIAIRGGGRFYLKLISGDGREYIYELRAQPNLMTTKVRVGKGIKTTYMAFDLITEGQDFDLDSIEFIPMTSGRRV